MKKFLLIALAILAIVPFSMAQKRGGKGGPLTLPALDSQVVEKYNTYVPKLEALLNDYNKETDSLKKVRISDQYIKLEEAINLQLLSIYAKNLDVEGVPERLFSLRTTIEKGEWEKIYKKFSAHVKQNDPYAKGLRTYIDTRQVQVGDTLGNFRAETSDGHPFSYSEFKDEKDVLVIFGSLSSLPVEARLVLQISYRDVDLSQLEIISVFTEETDKAEFQNLARTSGIEWLKICDFRGALSPLQIAFGVTTTPLCFYVSRGGAVEYISEGITNTIVEMIKEKSYKK